MRAPLTVARLRYSTRWLRGAGPGFGAALMAVRLLMVGTLPPTALAEDVPALLAVALDTSGSVAQGRLLEAGDLARGVLESLPRGSQLALFTFDDTSRLRLERTSDPAAITAALEAVRRKGRHTALHDALYDASVYLRDAPAGRKALLLVTDGRDERSAVRLEDGLGVARDSGIPVFAVGVGRVDEDVLRRVAKLTGGRYASLAEASGFEIASAILDLKPGAEPGSLSRGTTKAAVPEAEAEAAGAARPEQGSEGLSTRVLVLLFGLGTAVALAAAVGVLALRRAARRAPGRASGHASARALDATTLVPAPEIKPVAKTVLLARHPVLEVVEGPRAGTRIPLIEARTISLGRAPGNDVVLDDEAVSGEHCRVRPERGQFVLYDLDSTNGTFVNGQRSSRHVLVSGDSIRIGASRLEYSLG